MKFYDRSAVFTLICIHRNSTLRKGLWATVTRRMYHSDYMYILILENEKIQKIKTCKMINTLDKSTITMIQYFTLGLLKWIKKTKHISILSDSMVLVHTQVL